jgi:hypothetical protein
MSGGVKGREGAVMCRAAGSGADPQEPKRKDSHINVIDSRNKDEYRREMYYNKEKK